MFDVFFSLYNKSFALFHHGILYGDSLFV